MPGPKRQIPAPIDRPLSRAYLRQFKGWSTAYPPGLSDPTTLRQMENVYVDRDTSLRIRPSLRQLTFNSDGTPYARTTVGGFEPFYLNDGSLAYLFAVRDDDGGVSFRVGVPDSGNQWVVQGLGTVFSFDSTVWDYTWPAPGFSVDCTFVRYLQIDNRILALGESPEGETPIYFDVGPAKFARQLNTVTDPTWSPSHKPDIFHPDFATQVPNPTVGMTHETPTAGTAGDNTTGTLVSSSGKLNTYTVGVFYTFFNEVGETGPSQMATIKVRRPWASWLWEAANAAGEPNGTAINNPALVADQLYVNVASADYLAAAVEFALGWNCYMVTWSDQDSQPSEAILIGSNTFVKDPVLHAPIYLDASWIRITSEPPQQNYTLPLPTLANRRNSTDIGKPANGLVAADRMVLVGDRVNPARIRWSSNLQGEYTNFSSSRGGGYKTLTSGNLQLPCSVKLWQNPQSVDTITILTEGTGGMSTGYYMSPAEITGQTEATTIMAFEETTATPGTVSAFGVEVVNNALYHPLDLQLMKSVASNYNINHKSQTDLISNVWQRLQDKNLIVSCELDGRVYYLVKNDINFGGVGYGLDPEYHGDEIWVLDTATGVWSRWKVPGTCVQKVSYGGLLRVAVGGLDGWRVFADDGGQPSDETVVIGPGPSFTTSLENAAIPWLIETNTQGANRAHDAWAHVQQLGATFGNLYGQVRWGMRTWDINGKALEFSKVTRRPDASAAPMAEMPFDVEDFLQIRRDLKEWYFFAESVEVDGVVQTSSGGINFVQARYTPVSVNVGYEYGSVETFEYGRAENDGVRSQDGVPTPFIDMRRP